MKTASEALELAKTTPSKKAIAAAQHLLAKGQVMEKDLDKALATAQEAQAAFTALGCKDAVAATMTTTAAIYAAKKNGDKALDFTNQALDAFKALDLPRGMASVLKIVADLKLAEERYYHASLAVEDMIKYCHMAGDYEGEAFSDLFAAEIHFSQGDLQGAIDRASSAVEIFEMVRNEKKKAAAVHLMAKAFKQAEQQQDAVQAAEVAISLFQSCRDRKGMAAALLSLADIYSSMQQYSSAANKFEEACFIYRQLKDKRTEAKSMASLASVKLSMFEVSKDSQLGFTDSDFDECAKNAARAVELFGDGGLESGYAMLTQAGALRLSKKYDEALAKGLEAKQLFEAKTDLPGQASALFLLGNVYFDQDNKDEAISAMENAREIAEEAGEGPSVKETSKRIKDIGRYKQKKKGTDPPATDIESCFRGSDAIITVDKFETKMLQTGAPTKSGKMAMKDGKDFAAPQKQKVFYNLRMQHVPNVDLSAAAVTA
jgi:tetratricopeptide (TPR) repeat protein